MANIEALRQVQKQINIRPELHNQGSWGLISCEEAQKLNPTTVGLTFGLATHCGTAACVAGWAVELAGYDMVIEPRELESALVCDTDAVAVGTCTDGEYIYLIRDKAQELLGLTVDQASHLFSGANTRDQINVYIDALCEGRTYRDGCIHGDPEHLSEIIIRSDWHCD